MTSTGRLALNQTTQTNTEKIKKTNRIEKKLERQTNHAHAQPQTFDLFSTQTWTFQQTMHCKPKLPLYYNFYRNETCMNCHSQKDNE